MSISLLQRWSIRKKALVLTALVGLVSGVEATDLQDVLYGIAVVESRNTDLGLHSDGVSFGRYGVTYQAVGELRRTGRLGSETVNLEDPATNRRVAELYLRYLKDRYGSWWRAAEAYNPGSKRYAQRVWAAIDRRERNRA